MIINLTTLEMEIALAKFFNPRTNLIIPNVSWGMFNHECDLIVVGKSGLIREIEIKISKVDLIKDKEKRHKHKDKAISRLYFAIPEKLLSYIEHIPSHAGILSVSRFRKYYRTKIIRPAKTIGKYKVSDQDRLQLMRLSNLRIWGLKEKIIKLKKEKEILISKMQRKL